EASKSVSIAEKIAAKVGASTKKEDSLSVNKTSTTVELPVAKNTKNKKTLSVIKSTTVIKPST
ncbi:12838_t:CDS:1, partial [Cetraspora pellucida]